MSWPPGVPTGWAYPDVGLDRLVADAARDVPDGRAVHDGSHALTWAELAGLVDDVARGLSRRDPDRVVLVCGGALNALVVGLATWRLGAVLEVVDPTVKLDRLPGDRVAGDDPDPDGGDAAEGESAAEPDDAVGADIRDGEAPDTQPDAAPDRGDEVVMVVVDRRGRADPSTSHPVVVADVGRVVAQRGRRGRLRRWLSGRGPRIRGREPLSRLVADAGQAPLRAVDPSSPALVLHTPDGTVVATQRHLVAATFQVRLWIPDMATGTEVVAAARGWWEPGGWVVGPLLAALTAATCQLADADVLGQSVPGATVAFAVPSTWQDLVGGGGWRAALRRGDGWAEQADELRVAGVLLDPGRRPVERTLVDRLVAATEGARVRHAWQPELAAGPLLAQPLYGRFHGDPGALPLPDTVLALHDGHAWAHGPQVLSPATARDGVTDGTATVHGWTRLDDPALPIRGLLAAAGPEPARPPADAPRADAPRADDPPADDPPADDPSEGRP